MNKKIKSLICSILGISILCSTMPFSVNAFEGENNSGYKIDNALKNKLEEMDNDEKINISVWLKDIDIGLVEEQVSSYLSNQINGDSINASSVDLVFNGYRSFNPDFEGKNYNLLTKSNINNSNFSKSEEVTINQVQKVIEAERRVSSNLYQRQNEKFYNSLFSKVENYSLDIEQLEEPQVVYSCKYAPNIELYITKEQIYDIINSTMVEKIYYSDINCDMIPDDTIVNYTSESTNESDTYNTAYFNMTGIDTARDAWQLSGYGITVGIFDAAFTKPDRVDYLNGVDIDYSLVNSNNLSDNYSEHGSYMACLIAGLKKDGSKTTYVGAVPNAKIYCAAGYTYKKSLEDLIEKGCNVINMSLSYKNEYNKYGDISKWIDHMSYMHKTHFVCSAGNYGNSGVYSSNMAYNAIVVGNCFNTGVIKDTSSYISNDKLAYKPDIVAPGANAVAPPVGNSSSFNIGGTSAASAITCGAVAQLCQANPAFCANPTLLKSMLLSSAKSSYGSNTMAPVSDVSNSSIALSHNYGAGLLSVTNAYTSFVDSNNYKTSSLSPHSSLASYNIKISKVSDTRQKLLRVALVWDKPNTINNDHTSNLAVSPELDTFKLQIITPSGIIYTSDYKYDTKQYISFKTNESGTYKINIVRTGTTNSNQIINYALSYTLQ